MCLFIFMSTDYKSVYKCGDDLRSIQLLMWNAEYVKTKNIHFLVQLLNFQPENLPENWKNSKINGRAEMYHVWPQIVWNIFHGEQI